MRTSSAVGATTGAGGKASGSAMNEGTEAGVGTGADANCVCWFGLTNIPAFVDQGAGADHFLGLLQQEFIPDER